MASELTKCKLTKRGRFARVAWKVAWLLLCRYSPNVIHPWRVLVLKVFGARVDWSCHVYPSVEIWAPWNLFMEPHSCLGPSSRCYNVGRVMMGAGSIVSQGAYLCGATHDFRSPGFELICADILLGAQSWICADATVGPGVSVGAGAVVGLCSVAVRDVPEGTVVAGNPARIVSVRGRPVCGREDAGLS